MTPEDRQRLQGQRLQELAIEGASQAHNAMVRLQHLIDDPIVAKHVRQEMNDLGFSTCPHPDCVLVRIGGVETPPEVHADRFEECGHWKCDDVLKRHPELARLPVETPAQEPRERVLDSAKHFALAVQQNKKHSLTWLEGCAQTLLDQIEALRSAPSSPPPATEPQTTYRSTRDEILAAMDMFGGGFVKQLARLFRQGDPQNQRLQLHAEDFPEGTRVRITVQLELATPPVSQGQEPSR